VRLQRKSRNFLDIHTTPTVVRDLTTDVPPLTDQQLLEKCISKAAGAQLKSVELVSVFALGNDRQSLSYRLAFQHPQETMTNEQVEQILARVRLALQEQFAASFRS